MYGGSYKWKVYFINMVAPIQQNDYQLFLTKIFQIFTLTNRQRHGFMFHYFTDIVLIVGARNP